MNSADILNRDAAMMRYDATKKSQGVTFLLWWVLGIFGGHRFYLKHTGTAVAQLILALSVVGWPVLIIWLFVDLFLIWGMVTRYNQDLITNIQVQQRLTSGFLQA